MEIVLEILVIALLIAINGWFSMSELALVSARRGRLAVLERDGVRGALRAGELAEDPQRFLPAVQIGITLVAIVEGTFGAARIASHIAAVLARLPIIGSAADSLALTLMVVVITYLTLVAGELVPKQLALLWPERIAAAVAGPIAWFSRVTGPVVWVLGRSSGLVLRLLGAGQSARATVTEEEVKALVAEGAQTGVFETEERDMIERVLRLADKPVRALMTPRTGIVWIDRTDTPREIAQTLRSAPHSRFVVCDGSIDNVVGVVAAKDVLDRIIDGGELSIAAVLRQPMVVPDTVTALDALDRLKTDPVGMALVMDEYGTFEGVVTAADVLYAIVGDPGVEARTMGDLGGPAEATLELDGMTPVDEVKARLSLPDLPAEGSYHTLAGLLLALLRRVPQPGDRIVFAGWRFEVLAMSGRRVEKVRVSREEPAIT
jgi:putative hemolysin